MWSDSLIENTKVKVNGKNQEFDGMWSSSLTDSTLKGKPDIEAVLNPLAQSLYDKSDSMHPYNIFLLPLFK